VVVVVEVVVVEVDGDVVEVDADVVVVDVVGLGAGGSGVQPRTATAVTTNIVNCHHRNHFTTVTSRTASAARHDPLIVDGTGPGVPRVDP
jgi:hypothetical protein